MYRLLVLNDDGEPIVIRPLTPQPLYLGRAATNDIVLTDHAISSRHAAVWASNGRVFVEDLGSRNGTFAGERRVRQPMALRDGECLRLGRHVHLQVEPDPDAVATGPSLLVEEVDGPIRVPLRCDRLRIGPEAEAAIRVEGSEGVDLLVDPDGEVWLGEPDCELRLLPVGEPFAVGARRFCLVGAPLIASATWDVAEVAYPYQVTASLDGPTGPRAEVLDRSTGAVAMVDAANRATLLYLLAQRIVDDTARGVPIRDAGWAPDPEVARQMWGRLADGKNLNVLITRTRHDLRRGGIDPWCLEKRRGHVRLRVEQVEVVR